MHFVSFHARLRRAKLRERGEGKRSGRVPRSRVGLVCEQGTAPNRSRREGLREKESNVKGPGTTRPLRAKNNQFRPCVNTIFSPLARPRRAACRYTFRGGQFGEFTINLSCIKSRPFLARLAWPIGAAGRKGVRG